MRQPTNKVRVDFPLQKMESVKEDFASNSSLKILEIRYPFLSMFKPIAIRFELWIWAFCTK